MIEIGVGGAGEALLVAHLPRLEGLIHLVERVRKLVDGSTVGFEEDARALVAGSVAPPDVPRVLSRIAQRYGTPVPGLREFGLSRVFPEASDLGGRSHDAVIAETVRKLDSS